MTQPPPPAFLRLHLQGSILTAFVTPSVFIDGYRLPAKYGDNVFPIQPGDHVVSAHGQSLFKYGNAQQQISAAPGQEIEVWYAAPALTFLKGAMGPTKQKVPGLIGLFVGLGLLMVIAMLAVFAAVST